MVAFLSLNPLFQHPFERHNRTEGAIHTVQEIGWAVGVVVIQVLSIATLFRIRKALRIPLVRPQDEDNDSMEQRTLKLRELALNAAGVVAVAGLAQLFIVFAALFGFGFHSLDETAEDRLELNGFLQAIQAIITGFVLNVTLVQHVVLSDVSILWFTDLVTGEINSTEVVTAFSHMIAIGSTFALLSLNADQVEYGLVSQAEGIGVFQSILWSVIGSEIMILLVSFLSVGAIIRLRTDVQQEGFCRARNGATAPFRHYGYYIERLRRLTKQEMQEIILARRLENDRSLFVNIREALDGWNQQP